MSTANNAEGLFQEAARAFRNSLSPSELGELTEFSSAKEMIEELKERVSSYQKKSKLFACCERLERVSESLSPFFDIIEIFIQSNPEVPALIWGAIRMVFLLTSNFSSFLDKLLNMFEEIGGCLPGYAEYHTRLKNRQVFGNNDLGISQPESPRVLTALSYIYTDLMQFCQDACRLFGTKKRGARYKAAVIADMFWKPFDVKFKSILERLKIHQKLFHSEMQLEESRFIESQFRKRQRDSDNTDASIAEINLRLSELQKTVLEKEQTAMNYFDRISADLASAAWDGEPCRPRHDLGPQKVSTSFNEIFRTIATWINASDFSRELNKARKVRLDNTGKWFVASSCYKKFKLLETKPLETGSEPPEMQIMFIQAKPGYGKTILSSILIEDLAKPQETSRPGELQTPPILPVLYYHFASDKAEECSPANCLRACLHQIFHHNTKAPDVIDAISIFTGAEKTGQVHATDEEIRQCLLLLLLHLPPVTLIFDGLDECTDPPDLFKTVYDLCCCTGAKAIFLGRPSCKPPRGCNSFTVVSLEPSQNANDIRSYLRPEIECLKNDDLLPKFSSTDEIVELLACRSQGMFLWARLVVQYISHDWLSPRERADAVFDDAMLDGLENLYGKIIAMLERSHPSQQEKVHRIFQVIATRKSPFTIPELRQIVAVKPGRITREEDLIVDFQNCLPVMCGALVECDSGGHVRFIHASFREYISEIKYLHDSPLAITKQSSWLTLTTICLSYLTYDIPRAAITTAISSNIQRAMIAQYFPLLQYGVIRVQEQDHDIFNSDAPASKDELDKASGTLQALEKWIEQKLSVTAWIEATFLFRRFPTLEPLVNMIELWRLRYEVHRARADQILSLYRRLEQDLAALRNDWAQVLSNEPSAIWTSTIAAFSKSPFWVTPNDTTVTPLGEPPRSFPEGNAMDSRTSSMMLVKSQTSADKMTHATISVVPSRFLSPIYIKWSHLANIRISSQYVSTTKRNISLGHKDPTHLFNMNPGYIQYLCSGWKAQYQIQEISSQIVLFSVMLNLPTADVFEVLKIPVDSNETGKSVMWRFNFPVAISVDLADTLILRTLLSLRTGTARGDEKQSGKYAVYSQRLKNNFEFMSHYESMFSPMDDAIAFFDKETKSLVWRTLDIWSRKTSLPSGSTNQFIFRGQQSIKNSPERAIPGGRIFLFHPSRPCLAFTEWSRASIWCYNESDGPRRCYPFIQKAIVLISFWSDAYIRYVNWTSWTGYQATQSASQADRVSSMVPEELVETISIPALLETPNEFEGSYRGSDPSTSNNTSIIRRQTETMAVTKHGKPLGILQDGSTNQVVKITSIDGRTAQFGHVPSLQTWEPSSLTLLPITNSVRVVWDKELQNDYSVLDNPSQHLPSMIERTLQSVPLLEQIYSDDPEKPTDTEAEEHSAKTQMNKKRSRIEDDISRGQPKKRFNLIAKNNNITSGDVE